MVYSGCILLLAICNNGVNIFLYCTPLVWIGSILNTFAIKANYGKMPVFISNSWATGHVKSNMFIKELEYGDFHVVGNEFTKLIPLCDTWDFGWRIISIGDFMIMLFYFIIIYSSIKYKNKNYKRGC